MDFYEFIMVYLSMQHMVLVEKVFKTSFKTKIVVSNGQLLDGILDSGSTRTSKGSGRTPVWKAVEEELPTGYLNQTLKQKGFYLFSTSKITLSTVLTKSL